MTAERLGVNSLRRPGPSRGCSAAAIREMAYIENIEMGPHRCFTRGELFCPGTVSRLSDLGEGSVCGWWRRVGRRQPAGRAGVKRGPTPMRRPQICFGSAGQLAGREFELSPFER
jgi:hypothetical protein